MRLFTVLLFLSLNAFSQKIDGVWSDSTGSSFQNCTAIYTISNDSVYFSHYLEFNGQAFMEHGKGIIIRNAKNNSLNLVYHVTVTLPIEGWSSAGIHNLTLSPDGRTLRGTYFDNLGKTGPLVFKKVFPAK